MLVTNTTAQDYWFGPLHLLGGVGQTLTVDDTTATSLYLTEDSVADAINNLYNSGKITVSSAAAPFPRPTGVPSLLHGDGSPEGLVYAPQGSVYLRRDGTGANSLYTKTTGVTLNTGWENYTTTAVGPGTTYRKATAKAVTNTVTETDLLNGEISIGAGVLGTSGVARLTAWGDWINNTGSQQNGPRFKLKFGSTVVIDTGVPLVGQQTEASRWGWRIQCELMNLGAANSQWVNLMVHLAFDYAHNTQGGAGGSQFVTGEGSWGTATANSVAAPGGMAVGEGGNSSAVDSTVSEALVLSVINASATATYETKLYGALVEIV